MNVSESDWIRLRSVLILLLILTFCLYFPSLFHGVFSDDEIYLAYANRFLRESPWSSLHQLFLRPANPWEFLPLRDFTYWLDFRLYGDEPNGFHATNLVWYVASSVASAWLFRELILLCQPKWAVRATVLSLCGALVFVAHPAHVEVAAWIASRKDLIAGTLSFLSAAMLVHAIRHGWPCREVVLAALLLFAACFGKAAAMTNILFVTVLMGVGWSNSPEISRVKKVSYLFLFWLLAVLAFLIHFKVGESSGIRIENHPSLFLMLERSSRITATLVGILLFPSPLRFYYDVYQIGNWHWLLTVSVILLFLVSLLVLSKKRTLWTLGVVLMLSPLPVYLQLVPFTTWSLASERFVFVSVAGLALMLIDLLGRIANPGKIGALVLMITLPFAVTIWSRIADWGDGRAMMAREYALQPNFHNAIRDRVVFTLLPEKRYAEAEALAGQLKRRYAREALFALIGAEQTYRQMIEAKSALSGNGGEASQQGFCLAVAKLRSATLNGYEHIPEELDVSYNNMLRTLDQQLKYRYAESKYMCFGAKQV